LSENHQGNFNHKGHEGAQRTRGVQVRLFFLCVLCDFCGEGFPDLLVSDLPLCTFVSFVVKRFAFFDGADSEELRLHGNLCLMSVFALTSGEVCFSSVTSVVKVFRISWSLICLCVPSCPLWLSVLLFSMAQTQTHIQPFERGFRKRTHLRIRGAFSARSQLLPAERCGLQRQPRGAREDPVSVAKPRLPAAPLREIPLLWPPLHSWRLFPGECFSPRFEFS
jgi:hypothetical protein